MIEMCSPSFTCDGTEATDWCELPDGGAQFCCADGGVSTNAFCEEESDAGADGGSDEDGGSDADGGSDGGS
jgi:hypothetical protein